MRPYFILALLLLLGASSRVAEAASKPTYQSLWDKVAGKCRKETHPDLVLFYCQSPVAIWYFTQPGTGAHPGVIERKLIQSASGIGIEYHAWPFGPQASRAAFSALMASIQALDKDVVEDMKRSNQ
jgi:hypothetical protein